MAKRYLEVSIGRARREHVGARAEAEAGDAPRVAHLRRGGTMDTVLKSCFKKNLREGGLLFFGPFSPGRKEGN